MDSFFGIGAAELVVILFLAGLVMGPRRIRDVAFWLGKITAQLQSVSRRFTRQLNAELSSIDDDGDMKNAWSEVQDLRQQLADLKREITSVAIQPLLDGQKAVQEAKRTVDNTIRPPNLSPENWISKANALQSNSSQTDELGQNGEVNNLPSLVEVSDDLE